MTRQAVLFLSSIVSAFGLAAGCASVKQAEEGVPAEHCAAAAPTNAAAAAAAPAFPAPPPDGYDWDALARLAAANCDEARALLLDAEAERHQAAVDTGWKNPRLSAGRHWGREEDEMPGRTGERNDTNETGAGPRTFTRNREWGESDFAGHAASLRIYTVNPFVNRWLRKRGEASVQAKEAESKEAAYAVFCEVKSLCLEAEVARADLSLLEQTAALREQACALRREQSEAGVVSALELIRSETRLAALRAEIRERQTERQQLIRRIAVLSGVPVEQLRLREIGAARKVKPAYLDEAALTALAFLRRPDLARVQREREAAQYAVGAARAGQIPWFEYVEAQYEEENATSSSYEQFFSGYNRTEKDESEWQLRAAVTLPVFNWLGDEIRLTRTQLAAAETRVQGLHDQIRREVGGVLEDYRGAQAERDRIASECGRLRAAMTARIDALASEPTVRREDVLAAREELLEYVRICTKAERESQRLTQYLETVSGGPLTADE